MWETTEKDEKPLHDGKVKWLEDTYVMETYEAEDEEGRRKRTNKEDEEGRGGRRQKEEGRMMMMIIIIIIHQESQKCFTQWLTNTT